MFARSTLFVISTRAAVYFAMIGFVVGIPAVFIDADPVHLPDVELQEPITVYV